MAKTGRPPSENPLKYDIKVRLDEETFERLNEACANSGCDRAAFIRGAVLQQLDAADGGKGVHAGARKPAPPAKALKTGVQKAPGPSDTKTPKRAAAARAAKAAHKEAEEKHPQVNNKLDVWLM